MQVSVNLKAEYQNLFNWKSLDTCISITTLSSSLNQTLADMFKGVTCNDSTLNSSILKSLFIHDRYENCSTGKVIYNVTKDAEGQNELYCGNILLSHISLNIFVIISFLKSFNVYAIVFYFWYCEFIWITFFSIYWAISFFINSMWRFRNNWVNSTHDYNRINISDNYPGKFYIWNRCKVKCNLRLFKHNDTYHI